jgi:hypothetical protein
VGHLELVRAARGRASRPPKDQEAGALDGKTVRGAATAGQKGPHLLAFWTHETQETLLQVQVSEKPNEIPIAQDLVPFFSMPPRVETADALHTHASFMQTGYALCGCCGLTVKGNQPTLDADLATSFNDPSTVIAPSQRIRTVDVHRGRSEGRLLEVTISLHDDLAPAGPLVHQVARLTRTVTVRTTSKVTQEVVSLITDLTTAQASPHCLLDLTCGQGSIEQRVHSVRDVSSGVDRSRVQTGSAPPLLAALRTLAITLIHRTVE